jgi:hypothetical protein
VLRRSWDIWLVPLQNEKKARAFVRRPSRQWEPNISPDGRWLAYVSDETGHFEVYVTSFPSGEGKWQISTEGGTEIAWGPKGSELFWISGEKFMAVPIEDKIPFVAGKPRSLFSWNIHAYGAQRDYDVAPDGQRFLMLKPSEAESVPAQLNVVTNWFEELRKLTGK